MRPILTKWRMRRVCSRKIQPSQLIFTSELGPRRHAITLQNFYSFVIGALGLVAFFAR